MCHTYSLNILQTSDSDNNPVYRLPVGTPVISNVTDIRVLLSETTADVNSVKSVSLVACYEICKCFRSIMLLLYIAKKFCFEITASERNNC